MDSMNERLMSKCPFCGEEILLLGIRGRICGGYREGARYWEDFYVYKCQTCGGEWEINVKTGEKEITQYPNMKTLIQIKESREGEKKEVPTMQVSYNGFTGELVELARMETGKIGETVIPVDLPGASCKHVWFYGLSIYDSEKEVTHSFTGVKLEDVKFLGGVVSFGG